MASKRNWSTADREAAARLAAAWKRWADVHPGVTQARAAAALGMTQSALSQYVRGAVPLRTDAALKFARFLDVDVRELRPELGPKLLALGERPAEYVAIPQEAQDLARAWLSLPPNRREFFRQTIWLEAACRKLYPWLRFGKPDAESYAEFEEQLRQHSGKTRTK